MIEMIRNFAGSTDNPLANFPVSDNSSFVVHDSSVLTRQTLDVGRRRSAINQSQHFMHAQFLLILHTRFDFIIELISLVCNFIKLSQIRRRVCVCVCADDMPPIFAHDGMQFSTSCQFTVWYLMKQVCWCTEYCYNGPRYDRSIGTNSPRGNVTRILQLQCTVLRQRICRRCTQQIPTRQRNVLLVNFPAISLILIDFNHSIEANTYAIWYRYSIGMACATTVLGGHCVAGVV